MPFKLSPYNGGLPHFDPNASAIDSIIAKIAPSPISDSSSSLSFDISLYAWDDQKRLGIFSYTIIDKNVHLKYFPFHHFVRFYRIEQLLQYFVETLPSRVGFTPIHYYLYYRDTSQQDTSLPLPFISNLSFKSL